MEERDGARFEVVREGFGLHSGAPARVTLRKASGPTAFSRAGREIPVVETRVVGTFRATTVEVAGVPVSTVEHLFAACGGLGLHSGLSVEVTGPELPLLDGAARAWCDALLETGLQGVEPSLEVVHDAEIHVGESRYAFRHVPGVHVSVAIDFGDSRLAPRATWSGDARDFVDRIAPARTFAFRRDVEELLAHGHTSHVTPSSVVVIGEEVMSSGAPFSADEPARHKLLDLIGDLFLYGGPPRGEISALRPGHAATAAAMREALEGGIVRRRGVLSSARDA